MFTRISKALFCTAALAACAAQIGPAAQTLSLQVGGSDVVLAAPDGFCFDPVSLDRSGVGVSALMADCAVLGVGEPEGRPFGAVLSATVTREALPGNLAEMEGFLRSEPGRLALGGGAEVEVLASTQADGVLFLKLRQDTTRVLPTAAQEQWRGFFEASGRMVSVAVTGFQGAAPSDDLARGLIADMADRTRSLSS
ncbi:MAG: hypothetical protein AAFR93_10430 [Pseudomonadota bacterium]